jgi:hypothetical protein
VESEARARSDVNSERNANVLGARHEARIPSDAYHEAWVNEAWGRGDAKSEARTLEQVLSLVRNSGSLADLVVEHEAHRGCRDVNSARSPSDVDSEAGARGVLEAGARTTSDAHHEAWKQARSPSDVDSEVGARGVLEAEARTTSDAHHEAWKQAGPRPRKSFLLLPRESIR